MLLAIAAAASGCEGRTPRAGLDPPAEASEEARAPELRGSLETGSSLVELDLSKGIPEEAQSPLFGAPLRRSHLDLVRVLRSLTESGRRPKGVFVRLGVASVGLARAQ